jgi:xanthine dehydrogenase small subunit
LLLALRAAVHLAGPQGERLVPLESFFTGYRKTILGEGEFIVSIEIPKPLPQVLRFYKISKRRLDDISTVAAAFSLDLDPSGRVERVALAFGGLAATPIRAFEAEGELIGQPWSEGAIQKAAKALGNTLHPMSDHRGSADYRLEVAKSLLEKFWWEEGAR